MAATFVQAKINTDTGASGTSISVGITAAVAGNLLCGSVSYGDGAAITNVQDNNLVTATLIDTADDTTNGQAFTTFYFKNVSGGPTSIKANFNGTTGGFRIMVQEWSGLDTLTPLDAHTSHIANGASATSAAITTTANGDLIYGAVTVDTALTETVTQGASYTLRNNGSGATLGNTAADESQVQTTAGSVSATFSFTAAQGYVCLIAAFKAAASGDTLGGAMVRYFM